MNQFLGLKVVLEETGQIGRIDSSFGQGGKFKASFEQKLPDPPPEPEPAPASAGDKGKRKKKVQRTLKSKVVLRFKRYVHDEDSKKAFIQPF